MLDALFGLRACGHKCIVKQHRVDLRQTHQLFWLHDHWGLAVYFVFLELDLVHLNRVPSVLVLDIKHMIAHNLIMYDSRNDSLREIKKDFKNFIKFERFLANQRIHFDSQQ